MCCDGNGRYCAANPREGAKLIVAEAARNVVCVGARPIAITNCLNFASPERPEVMWSFSEVIDGMAEACECLKRQSFPETYPSTTKRKVEAFCRRP